jgi:DNA recombination protein RmuC
MLFFLGLLIGLFLAIIFMWLLLVKKNQAILLLTEKSSQALILKEELSKAHIIINETQARNSDLQVQVATLSAEQEKTVEFFNQRVSDLSSIQASMKEAFAVISQENLAKNSQILNLSLKTSMEHFFKSSEQDRKNSSTELTNIINPLKESLLSVDKKVAELELTRQGAYAGLKEQIENLLRSQHVLQTETKNLSQALNAPTIRGRWGEMQLRRVVELSGLSPHCDFLEQESIADDNQKLRPDMIITLPQNKKIVVDAKAPLDHVLDENRGGELASSLKRHLLSLKKKSYHSLLGQSPEFVVMFLPGEAFLHWALLADPELIDFAAQNEVILATPLTLVALLKAIAFGFRQESIANNIEEVRHLSQQLIDRIDKVYEHFEKLGKNLKSATNAYNQTLSSLDSRVLVTARKLADVKTVCQEIEQLKPKDDLPYIDTLVELSGEPESTI